MLFLCRTFKSVQGCFNKIYNCGFVPNCSSRIFYPVQSRSNLGEKSTCSGCRTQISSTVINRVVLVCYRNYPVDLVIKNTTCTCFLKCNVVEPWLCGVH